MSEPKPMLTADVLTAVIARLEKSEEELAAAQEREAKLRELAGKHLVFYGYQVLEILDSKEDTDGDL